MTGITASPQPPASIDPCQGSTYLAAKVDHTVYLLGSPAWIDTQLETGLSNKQKQQISELQVEGKTVMVLSTEQEVLLCIAVADELREHDVGERLVEVDSRRQCIHDVLSREISSIVVKKPVVGKRVHHWAWSPNFVVSALFKPVSIEDQRTVVRTSGFPV